MPDWTELLTEEERSIVAANVEFGQLYNMAHTIATLRALVEEQREALERVRHRALRIRQGEIETTSVGAADYDVQVAGLALALREDEMRKRLEEK